MAGVGGEGEGVWLVRGGEEEGEGAWLGRWDKVGV